MFFLETFGCKVNQYESQALREAWQALGGVETTDPARAAWIVLNTCAVTGQAVSDARQAVRRLHRLAPEAGIVVSGCSATAAGTELAALPGVVAVIPQADKERLLTGPPVSGIADGNEPVLPPGHFSAFHIRAFTRARPVIKVQDGCTHRCAYCIVPLMRGPSRSRPMAEVLAEAERLLSAGHRELMLSGINLHQYRVEDTHGRPADFWDLTAYLDRALAPRWQGKARLRISSIDPAQLGAKAEDTLAAARLVCPHLHLSLQSGSPSVLRRMHRGHYRPEIVLEQVRGMRAFWPLFGLGADILVGFPGESEAEHAATLALLDALPLSYGHVFPFSSRPGTAAALLPDIPGPEKQRRAHEARAVVKAKQQHFLAHMLTLPELTVALDSPHQAPEDMEDDAPQTPDTAAHLRGVSEYYTACIVRGTPETLHTRDLITVRPLGVAGVRLESALIENRQP